MFDRIHFEGNPFSMHNGVVGVGDYQALMQHEPPSPSPERSAMETSITSETDFIFQGEIQYLAEQPMSAQSREQYLYVQGFCLLRMGPQYYTSRRDYASYLIVYTYEGEGELLYDGRAYTLQAGDGFIIDCRRPHIYRTIGDLWVHADLHIIGGNADYLYAALFGGGAPSFSLPPDAEFQALLEDLLRIHTSISALREPQVSCAIQRLLLCIAESMERQNRTRSCPENIRYLMKYMELHFREEISLDDLAALAGLSKYHLCRQFKRYTSFTPKEYTIQLRMNRARQLLVNTSIPAYKVGILCGIPNEANFIRLFKENCGATPGEYRRRQGVRE